MVTESALFGGTMVSPLQGSVQVVLAQELPQLLLQLLPQLLSQLLLQLLLQELLHPLLQPLPQEPQPFPPAYLAAPRASYPKQVCRRHWSKSFCARMQSGPVKAVGVVLMAYASIEVPPFEEEAFLVCSIL